MERIIKNKRQSKCRLCYKEITTDYKVKYQANSYSTKRIYHLTCYYNWVIKQIVGHKKQLIELNKSKRKFKNYGKYMLLEKL